MNPFEVRQDRGTVAIEVTSNSRPAARHGIGRYVSQVISAATFNNYGVDPIAVRFREGRAAEFLDLLERRQILQRRRPDLFHATSAYTVAGRLKCRWIASILDVIPLEVDSYQRTGRKAQLFHRMAAGADLVLTLSDFSASRIAARLGVSDDRIIVAPLPVGPEFSPAKTNEDAIVMKRYGLEAPFFLAIAHYGSPDPRKRFVWLNRVAETLKSTGHSLVLVGEGSDRLPKLANRLGLGRLPDSELASLYRGARALAFTSAYEGQGLPLLEAMSCGTPVVAMANTSIPDVVGDGGLLIKEVSPPAKAAAGPHHVDDDGCLDLAATCRDLALNPSLRDELSLQALQQAKRYSFEGFASTLDGAYRRLL